MSIQRLEKGDQFWELVRTSRTITIRAGKIGTEGKSEKKTYATEREARLTHEKVFRERRMQGYMPVEPLAPARRGKPARKAPPPVAAPADAGASIPGLWRRLEACYAKHAAVAPKLAARAQSKDIAKGWATLGLEAPEALSASLAVHDGQRGGGPWAPGCGELGSMQDVVTWWRADSGWAKEFPPSGETQCRGRVLSAVFHDQRIPISRDEGDRVFVDLAPGPKGNPGQVIALVSECDFVVLAESFAAFLGGFADLLERGALEVATSDGVTELVPKGKKGWSEHPCEWLATALAPAPAAKKKAAGKKSPKKR